MGDHRDVRPHRGRPGIVRARLAAPSETVAVTLPRVSGTRFGNPFRVSIFIEKGAFMPRFGIAFGLALCCFGGAGVALAQAPGQGPPMPLAVDLAKIAAGSWADYQ